MAISKERAVEIVEALLAEERDNFPSLQRMAVIGVRETPVGWIVAWQSEEYKLNPIAGNALAGCLPYLVDIEDGSVYEIPGGAFNFADWQAMYLEQVKGVDAFLDSTREVIRARGRKDAIKFVRDNAPLLSLVEAVAYVDSVESAEGPPVDLVQKTRSPESRSRPKIKQVRGPES